MKHYLVSLSIVLLTVSLLGVSVQAETPQAETPKLGKQAISGPANMPTYREPTKFRIWNAGTEYGGFTTWIRIGDIENAGTLVYSSTVTLAVGERKSYDLTTIIEIIAPFSGHADIEGTQPLGYEYYLYAGSTNVTLHNLRPAMDTTIWLRYQDSAGALLREYTLILGPGEVRRLSATDYPPPAGWARIEFAGNGAFERWFSLMLGTLAK